MINLRKPLLAAILLASVATTAMADGWMLPVGGGGGGGTVTVNLANSGTITNPSNTLTLPATTTAYAAGQLICTSATAATCNAALASQFFQIVNTAGGALLPRISLYSTDATSTSWGASVISVDLWSAAPTFTNGDRGTWALATGSQTHLATYSCTMSAVNGDGLYSHCAPTVGSAPAPKLASGQNIYWTLETQSTSGVTGASKVFTLVVDTLN